MAFKAHEVFLPPEDPKSRIWRYMSLAKFLSVLHRSSLYFARVDSLSDLDPFEGYYTRQHLALEGIDFSALPPEWKESSGITTEHIFRSLQTALRYTRKVGKHHRSLTFVNCWHLQEHENAAFWKMYLTHEEGVAIQSTYERLVDSFADYSDFHVRIGRIQYIDYEEDAIPGGNLMSPFMYKRKAFEHESEIRALIWTPEHGKNDMVDPTKNRFRDTAGLFVPVKLDALVERILISPTGAPWLGDVVASVLSKYGLNKSAETSSLASGPPY